MTFFRNQYGFSEDICFDLIGMPVSKWVRMLKSLTKFGDQSNTVLSETLPFRRPDSGIERILFQVRDFLNKARIEKTIVDNRLNEFDIYHFEQGADPYRDSRWVKKLSQQGKKIVCFYHGTDVRNRGIFEDVHRLSQLNLTSEIDLLPKIPGMKYLYLPIDTEILKPKPRKPDGRIRISHAARNRMYKGSDRIEEVVLRLKAKYPIDLVMIEDRPHAEALELKGSSDIFIDQITDLGGWGYGASSVESLAMGIPTVTRVNPMVGEFLGEHPFVNADGDTLEKSLITLIEDEALRRKAGAFGRIWVIERHGLDSVMSMLYGYYHEAGLM